MPAEQPSIYVVMHEDGTYTQLTRDIAPDEAHASRAESTLASQNRRGYLIKIEGSLRSEPKITKIRAMNAPDGDFESVKTTFLRKQTSRNRPRHA